MQTIVLTRPTHAGIPGTIIQNVDVPVGDTVTVDSIPATYNMAVKWLYVLMDPVDSEVLSAEVMANHKYNTDPNHNAYSVVGSKIKHNTNVSISGSDLIFTITNNHSNDLIVNVVRIQLLN